MQIEIIQEQSSPFLIEYEMYARAEHTYDTVTLSEIDSEIRFKRPFEVKFWNGIQNIQLKNVWDFLLHMSASETLLLYSVNTKDSFIDVIRFKDDVLELEKIESPALIHLDEDYRESYRQPTYFNKNLKEINDSWHCEVDVFGLKDSDPKERMEYWVRQKRWLNLSNSCFNWDVHENWRFKIDLDPLNRRNPW